MDFRQIRFVGPGVVPAVVETSGVTTTTNAGNNNTPYKFRITQFVRALGRLVIEDISFVSPSTGTTPTSVSDALRANIIALKTLNVSVNAMGSATLIITAGAGDAIFNIIDLFNTTTVVTTAGVHAVGTYGELTAQGVPAVSGRLYTQVLFEYNQLAPAPVSGTTASAIQRTYLYVNQGDANFAAFNTRLNEVLKAYAPGLTVTDPKSVSLA